MTLHIGVDGCRGGWYAVQRDSANIGLSAAVYSTFDELLREAAGSAVVAVDIPIGLRSLGSRACDLQARAFLAPLRSSSVFPAPLRQVLNAVSQPDASSIHRAIDGKGVTIQAFAITKKIREVDLALAGRNGDGPSVREVHPEVSFAALNGDVPLSTKKKRAAGRMERISLLVTPFGDWPARLIASRPIPSVAADDVLDAIVALWSAERIGAGTAKSLPPIPERDEIGLPMAIFY